MINLIPTKVKKNIKFAKYNVLSVKYITLVLTLIAIMVGLLIYSKSTLTNTQSNLKRSVEENQARAAKLKSVNDDAKELSDTIKTIGNIFNQEVRFSELLKEIGAILPAGTTLSSLILSRDATNPVRLSVKLDTAEKAGVLQQNIIESKLFVGADIINVTDSTLDNSIYKFSGDLQAYYDPNFPLTSLGHIDAGATQ